MKVLAKRRLFKVYTLIPLNNVKINIATVVEFTYVKPVCTKFPICVPKPTCVYCVLCAACNTGAHENAFVIEWFTFRQRDKE